MRRYIDEYYEDGDDIWLSPTSNEIKQTVLQQHQEGKSVSEIVKYLQEWLYIFTDENETEWETEVVNNIIAGKPVLNRWTNIKFY